MRFIFVTDSGIIDSLSGEIVTEDRLESILMTKPGGVISGNNLYPLLAKLVPMVKGDHGWTASLKLQQKRKPLSGKVGGVIYFTRLSYRFPKERLHGKRYRPGSIKWLIMNMELFCETKDIQSATQALLSLADRRGVRPRYSPGAMGGALLRASPRWDSDRRPAPWFISEKARQYLPGNHYALRDSYTLKTVKQAYYLDQQSSHHTIASTIIIPHPHTMRARGYFRAVEAGRYPPWLSSTSDELLNHVGLLGAMVECMTIPRQRQHLYPRWACSPGKRFMWIWTPDLRLLDRFTQIRWVSCALTSYTPDLALLEYAQWCLHQLQHYKHDAIKSSLLAAYGLLGVRSGLEIDSYTIHGREKPPRAEECMMPIVGKSYRSTVVTRRVSAIQNVVARGVIEAETRARSLEYARELEGQGIPVAQIYADGIIVDTDQLPFVPKYWRVAAELTNWKSTAPNNLFSDNMVRTPGIPSGRRSVHFESVTSAA